MKGPINRRSAERSEAAAIVSGELERFRTRSYHELITLHDHVHRRVKGASGADYELVIQSFWDNPREKTNVRVMTSVWGLRKGWKAWLP